ncbi:Pectinesterase [Quillaja saponaria]|uniref:Pectinesterase n=1 Tax=Quillaja saponaria TaxID=32244 RepID=A0AAD7VJJ7_QUISA|nr:Pectinesterase [Quillaja saponaria]
MTNGTLELLISNPQGMHVDAIVASDGSGRYHKITEAVNAAPSYSNRRQPQFHARMDYIRTATVAVSGKGFRARDMTFRNTAGPQNHQAVALRVDSDQSAFYRCSMEGHQDTLHAHFLRECNVHGTIDFIFGNGAAVLQNCKIYTRVPLPLQKVTITAQGRKNPNQSTGFSI